MKQIDVQTTADEYSPAATIQDVWNASGGYFVVEGADVWMRLQYGRHGLDHWTDEFHVRPNNGILYPGTTGVAFRNYVAGTSATVSAAISEEVEPSVSLSSGGQGGGSTLNGLPVFNVQAAPYGAKGDGASDDTAAVQRAIAAANAAGGGIVYFPHGTYLLVFTNVASQFLLTPGANVMLWGAGTDATILRASGVTNGGNCAVIHTPNNGCAIYDLTLDLNSIARAGGIRTDANQFFKLMRCKVENESSTLGVIGALYLNGTDFEVCDNVFSNCWAVGGAGITRLTYSHNTHFAPATLNQTQSVLGGSFNSVISENIWFGPSGGTATGNGLDIGGSFNTSVTGNQIINFPGGIHLEGNPSGSYQIAISGNTIDAGASPGVSSGISVQADSGGNPVTHVAISGNTISGFLNAILVQGSAFVGMVGNTLRYSYNEAVLVTTFAGTVSARCSISANEIAGVSGAASGTFDGIRLTHGVSFLVASNDISGVGGFLPRYGISSDASSLSNLYLLNKADNPATGQYNLLGTAEAVSYVDVNTLGLVFNRAVFPGSGVTDGATQVATGLLAGTGVPTNSVGQNGDFYFRSDGGAGTAIYQRRGGVWVATAA